MQHTYRKTEGLSTRLRLETVLTLMELSKFAKRRDKELWLFEREEFCLPAYVREVLTEDESEAAWLVWPAMPFLNAPYSRFYDLLSLSAAARTGDTLVFDSKEKLEKALRKARGVTPEFYYRWRNEQGEVEEGEEIEEASDIEFPGEIDDGFLKEVVARTRICSLPSIKIIWAAVVQTAMQYLVVQRKPITLGFCTLFATPYRATGSRF